MKTDPKNILLVEGKDDLRVIPELIEANGVNWVTGNNNPVVHIRDNNGYQKLLDRDTISTELKGSGLSALGIMIDADNDPAGRWQSIRNAILNTIPDIPSILPEEGLIHPVPNGVKLGIWIMPDNRMRGMLETFLAYMIPDEEDALWQFAQQVTQSAKSQGAAFTDAHLDKANIYTWLAWQEPPGRQLHQAVKERILNPKHQKAEKFVTWFKTLYDLS